MPPLFPMPMLSTWPKLQSGRYDRTMLVLRDRDGPDDRAGRASPGPGRRHGGSGLCAFRDDLGRSSSGAWAGGMPAPRLASDRDLRGGRSSSVGRPSPAVAATVRPSVTTASAAASVDRLERWEPHGGKHSIGEGDRRRTGRRRASPGLRISRTGGRRGPRIGRSPREALQRSRSLPPTNSPRRLLQGQAAPTTGRPRGEQTVSRAASEPGRAGRAPCSPPAGADARPARASGPPGSRRRRPPGTSRAAGRSPRGGSGPARDRRDRRAPARRPSPTAGRPRPDRGRPAAPRRSAPCATSASRPRTASCPAIRDRRASGPAAPAPGTSPGTRPRPRARPEHPPADPQHHRPVTRDDRLERRPGRLRRPRPRTDRAAHASLSPPTAPTPKSRSRCRPASIRPPLMVAPPGPWPAPPLHSRTARPPGPAHSSSGVFLGLTPAASARFFAAFCPNYRNSPARYFSVTEGFG